jgi:NADPH:quinone reductase-like Zn-dependent oxidoreductase
VGPELAPLVDAASVLRHALAPLPAGIRFEARLASRLASPSPVADMIAALSEVTRRELRHPGRILITGAVSSAAVGVGFTVLARRRGSRRHAAAGGSPNGKGA